MDHCEMIKDLIALIAVIMFTAGLQAFLLAITG